MEVLFFWLAVVTLVNAGTLNKDEIGEFTKVIESPQQFAGCGISVVSEEGSGSRIYGGVNAAQNEFPWQAFVVVQNSAGTATGGGTLINPIWVMTAGHLTSGGTSGYVQLGSYHRTSQDSGQMDIFIDEFVTHPQYQGVDHNDIGLIKLVALAPLTDSIRPICLPAYSDFVGGGVQLTVSGWGLISSTESPDILQKASLTSLTTAECAATGLSNIDDYKICTKAVKGTGPCSGDSGGPLSLVSGGKTYSVGIASFIVNGCGGSYPSGFTRTTAYLTWISSTTGIAIDP